MISGIPASASLPAIAYTAAIDAPEISSAAWWGGHGGRSGPCAHKSEQLGIEHGGHVLPVELVVALVGRAIVAVVKGLELRVVAYCRSKSAAEALVQRGAGHRP